MVKEWTDGNYMETGAKIILSKSLLVQRSGGLKIAQYQGVAFIKEDAQKWSNWRGEEKVMKWKAEVKKL